MIRNSKHPGFAERRRLVRAFMKRMPNPSLSCEPNPSVSFTGISRYRDMASEYFLCLRVRILSEFRWYHGLVTVRPELTSFLSAWGFLCSDFYIKPKTEVFL